MSEGARANSIPLTCPLGHVREWNSQGVKNGAAKWCSAAGTCGRPLRRLTPDEEAAWIVGGQEAAAILVARKFEIAHNMEIVTRDDGMEMWVCTKGHMTPFKPIAPGKWICCSRAVGSLEIEAACGAPLMPATRAQVSAWMIGGEDAVVIP